MSDNEKLEDVDPAGVKTTDHLIIRDKESKRVLVNVRDSSKNNQDRENFNARRN